MVPPLPWISFPWAFYKASSVIAFSGLVHGCPPPPPCCPRLYPGFLFYCPINWFVYLTQRVVTYRALLLYCVMSEFVGIFIQCSESVQLSPFFANLHRIPHCVNSHVLIFSILALNSQTAVSFCPVNVHVCVCTFSVYSYVKSTRITNVKARETVLFVSASIVLGT